MRIGENQWKTFFLLLLIFAGCRDLRWAIKVPKTYKVLAMTDDNRLRESSVCYELRDSSGGAFGEILNQANFVISDEDELDAALKEAALVLQRSAVNFSVIYTTCLKLEGRDYDAWLLLDSQRTNAILLMVRG